MKKAKPNISRKALQCGAKKTNDKRQSRVELTLTILAALEHANPRLPKKSVRSIVAEYVNSVSHEGERRLTTGSVKIMATRHKALFAEKVREAEQNADDAVKAFNESIGTAEDDDSIIAAAMELAKLITNPAALKNYTPPRKPARKRKTANRSDAD